MKYELLLKLKKMWLSFISHKITKTKKEKQTNKQTKRKKNLDYVRVDLRHR